MKKKRNGEMDFWKFVFSIVIIFFHGKNMAGDETPLFVGGSIGVEFFFLVSGLLMANSAARNTDETLSPGLDTLHFMKKKICGLLPNIYVAWVIAFAVEHIGRFAPKQMLKDAANAVWELLFVTESGLLAYRANTVCWYISAMMLAMFLLYPLMRRYKDTYFYILAPLIVLSIMGLTYHYWRNLRLPHAWFGFAYKSLIRAVLGIALGSIVYKVSAYMRGIEYTNLARGLFTAAEWGIYLFVIAWSYGHGGDRHDWLLVLMLAAAITITFAQADLLGDVFGSGVFNWLGEYSFSLFLSHGFWSHRITVMFPELTYRQRLPIYFGLAIVTGLAVMYVSLGLRKWWEGHKENVLAKFVVAK